MKINDIANSICKNIIRTSNGKIIHSGDLMLLEYTNHPNKLKDIANKISYKEYFNELPKYMETFFPYSKISHFMIPEYFYVDEDHQHELFFHVNFTYEHLRPKFEYLPISDYYDYNLDERCIFFDIELLKNFISKEENRKMFFFLGGGNNKINFYDQYIWIKKILHGIENRKNWSKKTGKCPYLHIEAFHEKIKYDNKNSFYGMAKKRNQTYGIDLYLTKYKNDENKTYICKTF